MREANPFRGLFAGTTTLARRAIVALFALYVAQMLAGWAHVDVYRVLAWWPFGGGFQPWQPLTQLLVNGQDPIRVLLEWVFLYFLLPPVERTLGRRALLEAVGATLVFAIAFTLALNAVGVIGAPASASGVGPLLTALLLLFALLNPNASVLLFFVLPVRAIYLAWGSGILAFLTLLASRSLQSALWVGGWLGAWLWLRWRNRERKPPPRPGSKPTNRRPEAQVIVGPWGQSGKGGDPWVH